MVVIYIYIYMYVCVCLCIEKEEDHSVIDVFRSGHYYWMGGPLECDGKLEAPKKGPCLPPLQNGAISACMFARRMFFLEFRSSACFFLCDRMKQL